MIQAIIVLVLVGFLLISAEVCLPGLVLGILGALCLIASVVMSYIAFGPLWGTFAFAVLLVFGLIGFFLWLKYFPVSPVGRKILLHQSLPESNSMEVLHLIGSTGEAVTPLRPAGTALIEGLRRDVVAESGLIDAGEKITVVAQEGFRIVVRRATP